MAGRTEREDALLGAALLLVTASAAEGSIETPLVQRLLQGVGLHDLGVHLRARSDRIDALCDPFGVGVDQQLHSVLLRNLIAVPDHVAELPERIHVQQRKRRLRGKERFHRQVQHHAGVFPDRIQHDRVAELGGYLAHDADRFGLETLQVLGEGRGCFCSGGHE